MFAEPVINFAEPVINFAEPVINFAEPGIDSPELTPVPMPRTLRTPVVI